MASHGAQFLWSITLRRSRRCDPAAVRVSGMTNVEYSVTSHLTPTRTPVAPRRFDWKIKMYINRVKSVGSQALAQRCQTMVGKYGTSG